MSWSTISTSDLNDARAAALVDALRTAALADGQTDPSPRIIAEAANEMRACIARGGIPVDATDGSIPDGLRTIFVQHVIALLKARLLMDLTDDEKDAEKLYQTRLGQLTRNAWPVDATDNPLSPAAVAAGTSVEQASGQARQLTRCSMDGL